MSDVLPAPENLDPDPQAQVAVESVSLPNPISRIQPAATGTLPTNNQADTSSKLDENDKVRPNKPQDRVTGIEITNYLAYRGRFRIDLQNGENLIVYGENGSGKSSMYRTLRHFFEAPDTRITTSEEGKKTSRPMRLDDNEHRFTKDRPAIKVDLGDRSFEWTDAKNETTNENIRLINQGKGFLDYRALLEVHYVREGANDELDLFPLLINRLLPYYGYPRDGKNVTFQAAWRILKANAQARWQSGAEEAFRGDLSAFNDALAKAVNDLGARATVMLEAFGDGFAVEFVFDKAEFKEGPKRIEGPHIRVRPAFRKLQVSDYHTFFNEARLSAVALCLFFAALKDSPATGLRILALDDVLIGLDMANRVKVLDLVNKYFADWQILIFTYSKAWFERLKEGVKPLKWRTPWLAVVLWEEWHDEETSPRIVAEGSGDLLEMAVSHLKQKDYTAAAVYARKALESLCHSTCAKASLYVVHVEQLKQRKVEHFLTVLVPRLEELVDDSRRASALEILARLEPARAFVFNRNAHFEVEEEDTLSAEVGAAIEVVQDLTQFLQQQSWKHSNFKTGYKPSSLQEIRAQLAAARHFETEGALAQCQEALRSAHRLFWEEYGKKLGVLLPIGTEVTPSTAWKAAEEQGKLPADAMARLAAARPYLFGSVKASEFNAASFKSAADLLEKLAGA